MAKPKDPPPPKTIRCGGCGQDVPIGQWFTHAKTCPRTNQ